MAKSLRKDGVGLEDRTRNHPHTRWMRIQPSYCAQSKTGIRTSMGWYLESEQQIPCLKPGIWCKDIDGLVYEQQIPGLKPDILCKDINELVYRV